MSGGEPPAALKLEEMLKGGNKRKNFDPLTHGL